MEAIKKILGLVQEDKKEDAEKIASEIKVKIEGLDKEVQSEQAKKLEAIKSRDEIKTKLKEVAKEIGVKDAESISEAIKGIKDKKSANASEITEIKDKEIQQLKKEIEEANEKIQTAEKNYKSEILQVVLEKEIAQELPKYNIKAEGMKYAMQDIKDMAVYEEGKIVFKNEDGTTKRKDGSDLDISGAIEIVKEKAPIFFESDIQQSGALTSGGGESTQIDESPKF